MPRIAAVVDVRSRAFTTDLQSAFDELEARGAHPRVVFLEASDDVLVRRFESVRRPHPLQADGRVVDGIDRERDAAARGARARPTWSSTPARSTSTSCAPRSSAFFGGEGDESSLRATVVSFGYKYGLPVDADLVVDCRFLPNPHWVPELRPHTGRDAPVRDYVLSRPGAKEFLDAYTEVLRLLVEGYEREGKHYVTFAVGCTGGKHRSVAMAEQLGGRLRDEGLDVQVIHRDLGRE